MFRKLFTLISVIISLFLAVAGLFMINQTSAESTHATASISPNSNTIAVSSKNGVLGQVGDDVDISISAPNANLTLVVGRSSDITLWLQNSDYYSVNGLRTWSEEQVELRESRNQNTDSLPDIIKSDIWKQYQNANDNIATSLKYAKSKNLSFILIAKSNDDTKIGDLRISISWHMSVAANDYFPFLLGSILFLISPLLLNLIWRTKNKNGLHRSESKKLNDIARGEIGEFSLPRSAQIRNVREFAKLSDSLARESPFIGTHVDFDASRTRDGVSSYDYDSYFVSPIPGNSWRYYGEDSSKKEIYDAQVSRTAIVSSSENVDSNHVGNYSKNKFFSTLSEFNAESKLSKAPSSAKVVKYDRRKSRTTYFSDKNTTR